MSTSTEGLGRPKRHGWYNVPDGPPLTQPHSRQILDWEAPVSRTVSFSVQQNTIRSLGTQAEDRYWLGTPSLMAEQEYGLTTNHMVWWCLQGHWWGQRIQVLHPCHSRFVGRQARPSQCHQEVALIWSHPFQFYGSWGCHLLTRFGNWKTITSGGERSLWTEVPMKQQTWAQWSAHWTSGAPHTFKA